MKLLNPSLLVLSCFVIGGMIFKSTAPTRCATLFSNDSIFVLTGDARRIPFALRQLRRYPDAQLYIIGAGGTGNYHTHQQVVIESDSKSTYQNAVAIRQIAHDQGLDRIVLVTTVDHFNRAKYLIRQEMPYVEITPCPVPLNGMPVGKRIERWTTEYIKYIGTLLGFKESI
ncbi:YdcF family protein [bacterium]|nr:YdcF family protein [bacterium]